MTVDELKAKLTASGILGIHVEDLPPETDHDRLTFAGSLEEYIATLKALALGSVVIYSSDLHDGYFLHTGDVSTEDKEEGSDTDEKIDLCALNPELQCFKTYIGRTGLCRLSAILGSQYLEVEVMEPWWREFLEARAQTIEGWEDKEAEHAAHEATVQSEQYEALIQKLQALLDDPKFAKLPTQKAMTQYALRHVEGLDELDGSDLKQEIGNLKAILDAR